MTFYKKKLRYHQESKIERKSSPGAIAGNPKLNGFFCVPVVIFVLNVIQPDV